MDTDRPPSFQFYPADWLSSAAVARMSLEARGAYVNLLCHAWLQPEPGTLPDDDAALAALSGAGERWPSVSQAIRLGFRKRGNMLVQDRMCRERVAQRRRYENARRGSDVTNEKRWGSVASESRAVTPSSSSSSSTEESKDSPTATLPRNVERNGTAESRSTVEAENLRVSEALRQVEALKRRVAP